MRVLIALLLLAGCNAPGPSAPPPEATRTGTPEAEAPRTAPEADRPDLGALPDLVHRATNEARRDEGVSTLGWRDDLAAVAASHSRDMAARDYFAHDTPEGQTPQDRATAAGIACRIELGGGRARVGVAENLYQSSAYRQVRTRTLGGVTTREVDWFSADALADGTVQGWLDSPGHRRNLLEPVSRAHGIGVAVRGETVYVTQVLC